MAWEHWLSAHLEAREYVAAALTEEERSSIEGFMDGSQPSADNGPTKEEP